MLLASVPLGLLLALGFPSDPGTRAVLLPNGLALPYPTIDVYRAFGRCTVGGRHDHEAIDLGGVGPIGGLGTAVRSLTRARITLVGLGREDPIRFGVPDDGYGDVHRNEMDFPRRGSIDGYGDVLFFTKRQGAWRTGNLVETEGLGAPLAAHRIRYMHLAAVRPDLAQGDIVEAGEEIGLLGGTGVQEDWPHVHVDVRDAAGLPVDVAPLIGLPRSAACGPTARRGGRDYRAFKRLAGTVDWRPDLWAPPVGIPNLVTTPTPPSLPIDLLVTPPPLVTAGLLPVRSRVWRKRFGLGRCGVWREKDDFATGAFEAHVFLADLRARQTVDVTLVHEAGATPPALAVVDLRGRSLMAEGAWSEPTRRGRTFRSSFVSDLDMRVLVALVAPPSEVRRAVRYELVLRVRCTLPSGQ